MLGEVDERSIRRLHDEWVEAELRGDAETVLSLCTDDVEWVPPSGPAILGREAGRPLLMTSGVQCVSITITDFALTGDGSRAFKTCRYETVFETTETGIRTVARGSHTWMLERTAHGWRVSSVAWQPDAQTGAQ